ncbi:MAG: hypothetical protein EP338_08640 [Bacteroidetes bacterium]|nr:MAG: hypothetical protein EP338_08640 [Bacteroidota bacterium]
MGSDKAKILLVWGYHRKGWIEPFEKLKKDFDFVYLDHLERADEEQSLVDLPRYYWMDYKSPYQLLDDIQPDRVIFMSITRSNAMALNQACRHRRIKTYILQHGILHPFSFYLENNQKEMSHLREQGKKWQSALNKKQQWHFLFFLLRAMRWNNLNPYFFFLRFLIGKKVHGENLQLLLKSLASEATRPHKYLVFTKENAGLFKERDGAKDSDFIELGNPFLDDFFQEPAQDIGQYYLLIDEPLAYMNDPNAEGFFKQEEVIEFQRKLNDFARSKGKKLYIKLHPYSYGNDFYLQDENIVHFEDADTPKLIREASGIFGSTSTLLIPAIFLNKCILFKIWDFSEFAADSQQWGLVQSLDFHRFSKEDINFEAFEKRKEQLQLMIDKYMYRIDGKAIERLKEALQHAD